LPLPSSRSSSGIPAGSRDREKLRTGRPPRPWGPFLGKPTVINFFATWCPPCREEIPGFVEVYDKYRGSGFEIVGISFDTDTKGDLPAFMMENRIGYRILMGDMATARAYGVNPLPTTFFVGKDGRIMNVHVGYIDKETFEREVRKLL
jgi:thiol-disulfide isomerase/thioredoxin